MEYDRLLEKSESRYRRLFEAARDGILILDADTGKIIDANPFMSGLLGYAHDDFLGKELWEIGLFGDIEESRAAYRELQEKGYIRYENLPLRTRSGQRGRGRVRQQRLPGGRPPGRPVQHPGHHRPQPPGAADAGAGGGIGEPHRRKDEFLAMLSHELRNPLAPILNAVHLRRSRGGETRSSRKARSVIERQVGNCHASSMTCWRSPGSRPGK